MMNRRHLLKIGSFGFGALLSHKTSFASKKIPVNKKPVVLSTWEVGINANKGAWEILRNNGSALVAVEKGVMVTESETSCCVGLGAYPDRDGYVTLDASIMNEKGNCGSVAFLQRIKHPVSVARKVMENTPHVMLVGEGAQQFALQQGFTLEEEKLSESAAKAYDEWKIKSEYKTEKIIMIPTARIQMMPPGISAETSLPTGVPLK